MPLTSGLLIAFTFGLILGWLRYWIGYFVLAQGVIAGLGIPWILGIIARERGISLEDPRARGPFYLAVPCFAVFLVAHAIGFGLAQPWFEPVGWLSRVLEGDSSEFVFGVASTGGMHRGFAMGAHGWLWVVLSLVDHAILFFFLLSMPSINSGSKKNAGAPQGAAP